MNNSNQNNTMIQNDNRGNTNQSISNSIAPERPTTNRRCGNCKEEGHTRTNCPVVKMGEGCKREGHTSTNCPDA
ncbi:PREDICTED: ATP-dependent RNA helicase glh-2-like [Wasmannia auropunctata]|uniref:ATP-dependent RNA helicase glh-2-like n=1 Tax=Wasmannia auropunctata TaxID=64793 RepID=UPI0005EE1EF0|nr:PREDICTED: ATP-dependent RNA helicase glh-2-like [Wasmannia auropunctata]